MLALWYTMVQSLVFATEHGGYSLILARILSRILRQLTVQDLEQAKQSNSTHSLSRKIWYSSSPTLTGEPPYCIEEILC